MLVDAGGGMASSRTGPELDLHWNLFPFPILTQKQHDHTRCQPVAAEAKRRKGAVFGFTICRYERAVIASRSSFGSWAAFPGRMIANVRSHHQAVCDFR